MTIKSFLENTIEGKISLKEQKDFLMKKDNITAKELTEAIKFLRSKQTIQINLKDAIDVCGTGGSGLPRINTSTISSFILASLSVKIAKHGNRAASGRFGSFDLLEALDISFLKTKQEIEKSYEDTNIAFLFAPYFYSVMRHFSEIRKKIGKPTFFNILGPLLSPVDCKKQIIGTAFEDKMELIAETCKLLGKEKVYVIRGEDGLDEVTLTGKTKVIELSDNKIKKYYISPEDFGVSTSNFEEIKGGDKNYNTKIALDILSNKCSTRHVDLVLINTALALKLTGKVKTLKEAYMLSKKAIEENEVLEVFEKIKRNFNKSNILVDIIDNKRKEIKKFEKKDQLEKNKRSFLNALEKKGVSLISEIKKSSPSKGEIIKNINISEIAKTYEASGASAISVLCDKKYFGGSLEDMRTVFKGTSSIPILCKDFIIDESQIYEARYYGASAILLIATVFSTKQLENFLSIARSLGMNALVEVRSEEELKRILKTSAKIIGINNRNLDTFEIDIKTTNKLAMLVPEDIVLVSESGINSREDVLSLPSKVNGILVGTSILQSESISEKIKELII